MLYGGSDTIRDIEWVIFDEVHYVNDSEVQNYTCGCTCVYHADSVVCPSACSVQLYFV